jgi:CRISPR-associated endonuclease Cas2
MYDIPNTNKRRQLASYLDRRGTKLQNSVFYVYLKKYEIKNFLSKIEKITKKEGEVIVLRQCQSCKKWALRLSDKDDDKDNYYIC